MIRIVTTLPFRVEASAVTQLAGRGKLHIPSPGVKIAK